MKNRDFLETLLAFGLLIFLMFMFASLLYLDKKANDGEVIVIRVKCK